MFSSEVFRQISDGVTLDLKYAGIKWDAASRLRPDAECVINIIFIKTRSFDFFYRKIFCQLIDNRADDFDMGKFLCSYRSNGNVPYPEKR